MASSMITLQLRLLCLLLGSVVPGSNDLIHGTMNHASIDVHIRSTTLPNGYIAHPDIGVALKVYNNSVSWMVARVECNLDGGHLAVVDSYTKLEYVLRQATSHAIHVGILRIYDDEVWVRVDDASPIVSIPWSAGEPSNVWDCVLINKDTGRLENLRCTTLADYVCEISIPRNYVAEGLSSFGQISVN